MRTNTLVLMGFLGASLAGCEIRCLAPRDKPAPRTTNTGTKLNVNLVDYERADTGQPDELPGPSDTDASHTLRLPPRSR